MVVDEFTQRPFAVPTSDDGIVVWAAATPGACRIGSIPGSDDPERLGWDKIVRLLRHHHAFSFRLIPVLVLNEIGDRLDAAGYNLDPEPVFSTSATTIRSVAWPIAADGPPSGYVEVAPDRSLDSDERKSVQALLAKYIGPTVASNILDGALTPPVVVAAADSTGRIVGVGIGAFPHNSHSPHVSTGWAGLIVTESAARQSGVGRWVNAQVAAKLVDDHGATSVYQSVPTRNVVMRRVAESCGLALDPSMRCGLATRREDDGGAR